MFKYSGKSVYKGIAMGKVLVFNKEEDVVIREKVEDTEAEVARLGAAIEKSQKQLQDLYEKAVKDFLGIFAIHTGCTVENRLFVLPQSDGSSQEELSDEYVGVAHHGQQ